MKWGTLVVLVILLAIAMALGFVYEPIVSLASLLGLIILGVYTLYKFSEEGKKRKKRRHRF